MNLTTRAAVVAMLVMVGGIIFHGGGRLAAMESEIKDLKQSMDRYGAAVVAAETRAVAEGAAVRADAAAREGRLRIVETRQAGDAERLAAIYAAVQRIERLIESGGTR
ncbi:MAG TPA: hypothetical protein PKC84_18875 [Paracoccaceae bacterium]|nr:hypothetical protein [Paracoccaceae bacterium]